MQGWKEFMRMQILSEEQVFGNPKALEGFLRFHMSAVPVTQVEPNNSAYALPVSWTNRQGKPENGSISIL